MACGRGWARVTPAGAESGVPSPAADLPPALILASASPRRADLLAALGVAFTVRAADVDETPRPDEPPDAYVERLARAKARAIAAAVGTEAILGGEALVIAADTIVVLDGHLLGKPTGPADARIMLAALSDQTHEVKTGVAVAAIAAHGPIATDVCTTSVTFRALDQAEIDWYVATGEPLDKAGAYGIQGWGGIFVERITGSYHNVVGLPIHTVDDLLRLHGRPLRAWTTRASPNEPVREAVAPTTRTPTGSADSTKR